MEDIIQANASHLASTMELFGLVTDKMLKENIDQWNYDYPDEETVYRDICEGHQYSILHEGQVVATAALNQIQDPQYHNVHWSTINKNIFSIHRLGVHPDFQGQGLGKKMCRFAEGLALSQGCRAIRLDAYAGNPYANKLYLTMGYRRAHGYCYFRKKAIPFYCYEKVL